MGDYTISNDTFAILWGSVLFVEETEVFNENNQSGRRKVQMLPHNFFYCDTRHGCDEINNLIASGNDCNHDSLPDNTAWLMKPSQNYNLLH